MKKIVSLLVSIPLMFALVVPAWGFRTAAIAQCAEACDLGYASCLATSCECSFGNCTCGRIALLQCQAQRVGCNGICAINVGDSDISFPARLDRNQRHVLVSVPLECPAGLDLKLLHVTVSQRTTGAIAEGFTQGNCEDGPTFSVAAHVLGGTKFAAPATVQVCALAQLGIPSLDTDSKQWCDEGFLLPQGFELVD